MSARRRGQRGSRVSINRAGTSPSNEPLVGNHPSTSITTSADGAGVNSETLPPVPSFTITRFGTVCPPTKLRFDDRGRALPAGHTVRNDGPTGLVTVTFKTTEPAPAGGPPGWPVMATSVVVPPTIDVVSRVSSRRAGTRGVNALPVGNQPSTSTTTSTLPVLL